MIAVAFRELLGDADDDRDRGGDAARDGDGDDDGGEERQQRDDDHDHPRVGLDGEDDLLLVLHVLRGGVVERLHSVFDAMDLVLDGRDFFVRVGTRLDLAALDALRDRLECADVRGDVGAGRADQILLLVVLDEALERGEIVIERAAGLLPLA